MQGSTDSLSVLSPAMGSSSTVLLTPGRTRNIAQDMEALRLSRQDNPYLQQVMASRESLIESHAEEYESDDTILMSQEFGSAALSFVEEDPLTLKEVHEHMIRSPPPTSCWPHEGMSHRATSAFEFGDDARDLFSSMSVDSQHEKEMLRSPRRVCAGAEGSRGSAGAGAGAGPAGVGGSRGRVRPSRSASPRKHDVTRPLSLPAENHLRNALGRKQNGPASERFSLLQHPRPLRRRPDDSIRLVADCDK